MLCYKMLSISTCLCLRSFPGNTILVWNGAETRSGQLPTADGSPLLFQCLPMQRQRRLPLISTTLLSILYLSGSDCALQVSISSFLGFVTVFTSISTVSNLCLPCPTNANAYLVAPSCLLPIAAPASRWILLKLWSWYRRPEKDSLIIVLLGSRVRGLWA
jgi:hypothetical protein